MQTPHDQHTITLQALAQQIKTWGRELGFQHIGITDIALHEDAQHLQAWLAKGFHGAMEYMHKHGLKRAQPETLVPDTVRVIAARMDYFPPAAHDAKTVLADPQLAYVSRYALGRDYHKLVRRRLAQLAEKIAVAVEETATIEKPGYRVFTDSAPVLEKALARNAGLGWIGKHTNLINSKAGSWFFLGEIFTTLPLPVDAPASNHCGSCTTCIEVCPTQAIIAPYTLDARRCISYLTIELRTAIPENLRKPIGNRIYGCDDCQLFCPWNKFAQHSTEKDFTPRHELDTAQLITLFAWEEADFLTRTEGSAIRRIGYECWLRNIAVALGNAPTSTAVLEALHKRSAHPSELVREHVAWALEQHTSCMHST